tara:strand:- start:533 stop:1195 length:663 start_codon:yes stop_codon:yes gene_type:complete
MKYVGAQPKLYKQRVTLDLAAIPIKVYETDFKLKPELIEKIKNYSFHTDKDRIKVNLSSSQSILTEYEELKHIKDYMNAIALDYVKNVLEIDNDIYMCHSWVAMTDPGKSHHEHTHQNAFFSIVYYVNVESGNLNLVVEKSSIEKLFNFHYKIKNYNIYNSCSWSITPGVGDFIVFPADLRHSTAKNESDQQRIIFGANYFLSGESGDQIQLTKLDISWP